MLDFLSTEINNWNWGQNVMLPLPGEILASEENYFTFRREEKNRGGIHCRVEQIYICGFFFFFVPQLYLWGSPLFGEIFAYVTVF